MIKITIKIKQQHVGAPTKEQQRLRGMLNTGSILEGYGFKIDTSKMDESLPNELHYMKDVSDSAALHLYIEPENGKNVKMRIKPESGKYGALGIETTYNEIPAILEGYLEQNQLLSRLK